MDKRFYAILIIAALFFSITGVMADDSGSGGADDSSDNSADDSSNDSSGDNTDDSIDTSPTHDDGIDTSPTHDDGIDTSPKRDDSVDTGTDDTSGDRVDNRIDANPDDKTGAAERETETEIEHGIATIMTDESRQLSASPLAQPVIMTRSLVSLSSLPGTGPARMAELAKTVDDSYGHLSEAERSIRDRSGIVTFFFGGDDAAADDIGSHLTEDSAALDEIERMVNDPSASPALKAFTQARLRIIRADLEHWQELAAAEKAKSGLFG